MKKQFLFGLLAAGLLTACSSDDSQVEINKENGYELVEGQPAFISLGIALPGEPATRANDEFDDGESDGSEFEVKSGKLVIFKGTSESNATLFGAYDIPTTLAFSKETTNQQITTSSAKYVQEIESPALTGSEKLFAYVILNNSGNNTGLTYVTGTTWDDFSQKVLTAIGLNASDEALGQGAMGSNGLVMTSVPLSTVAGGVADPSSGDIVTLAEIDKTAIYSTEAAAAASTSSTCIYVERAAAKVQVGLNTTTPPTDLTLAKNEVKLLGWALGNVNNAGTGSGYYNTRQVEDTWSPYFNAMNTVSTTKYRFVCANALLPALPPASAHAERYRTYFAKDVNYKGTGVKTGLINSKVTTYGNADGKYTYTYENTFDADNQIYANTTFAGIKLEMNDGDTYYTIGGDTKTMYATEADAKAKLAENIAAQATPDITTIITGINTAITTALGGTSALLTAVTANGGSATSTISYSLTPVVDFGTYDATSCTYSACTATLAFKEIKQDGVVLDPADATDAAVITAINALEYVTSVSVEDKLANPGLTFTPEKVTQYTDGVTYYAVRIAHFGDYETPWTAPTTAYNDYDKIYPTTGKSTHTTSIDYGASRAAAWLGRWGVVRNNWYKLSIDKINAVGSPVPVDFGDSAPGKPGSTPDDNPEKFYISAHVHIVPWVLREQAVDLK